ncbi:hypothetical protein KTAU_30760 [Thermogemmatispora aurantia]|nr:hypothetical protein KTAU_30760 [Thermogemmatispora aurantia]
MTEPDNTYVIDTEHAAELARLMQQDRLLTKAMGACYPRKGSASPRWAVCWTWPVARAAGCWN